MKWSFFYQRYKKRDEQIRWNKYTYKNWYKYEMRRYGVANPPITEKILCEQVLGIMHSNKCM